MSAAMVSMAVCSRSSSDAVAAGRRAKRGRATDRSRTASRSAWLSRSRAIGCKSLLSMEDTPPLLLMEGYYPIRTTDFQRETARKCGQLYDFIRKSPNALGVRYLGLMSSKMRLGRMACSQIVMCEIRSAPTISLRTEGPAFLRRRQDICAGECLIRSHHNCVRNGRSRAGRCADYGLCRKDRYLQ